MSSRTYKSTSAPRSAVDSDTERRQCPGRGIRTQMRTRVVRGYVGAAAGLLVTLVAAACSTGEGSIGVVRNRRPRSAREHARRPAPANERHERRDADTDRRADGDHAARRAAGQQQRRSGREQHADVAQQRVHWLVQLLGLPCHAHEPRWEVHVHGERSVVRPEREQHGQHGGRRSGGKLVGNHQRLHRHRKRQHHDVLARNARRRALNDSRAMRRQS